MSTYDPRIVAQALEDLENELTRWSSLASETLAFAAEQQRHAQEAVERALHDAAILLDRAKDDEENVKKTKATVANAVDESTAAKTTSYQTLGDATNIEQSASQTLQKWQAELQKALAWLAKAKARLDRAIQELNRAISALRSANWSLSSAEASYRSCMNDKERSNCNGEAAAVSRAKAAVYQAEVWVAAAEREVDDARDEVARAEFRVSCCEKAVGFSEQALGLAQESVTSAGQAVNSAEQSLEYATAAWNWVQTAENKMLDEVQAAENMMQDTRAAQEFTDSAAAKLRTADGAEDSAQIHSKLVRKELDHRGQLLQEINRPTLASAVGITSMGHGTASSKWINHGIAVSGIGNIADPDGISGSGDFKKVSEAKMREGLERWSAMRPAIENGEGANTDYWARVDREKGLSYEDGYQRVYEAFYGQDHIKIDKVGDSYDIINGRHRIWLAKRMGINELPMQIIEKGK